MRKIRALIILILFIALASIVFAEPLYYESLRQVKYDQICPKTNQPNYVLISWNMGGLVSCRNKKSMNVIANILRDADIVVLQNVRSINGIKMNIEELAKMLDTKDRNWDYITSRNVDGDRGDIAFLWDMGKVNINNVHMIRTSRSCGHLMERAPVIGSFIFNKERFRIVSFVVSSSNEKAQKEIGNYISCDRLNKDPLVALGNFNLPSRKVNPIFREYGFINQTDSKSTFLKDKSGGLFLHKAYNHIFTNNSIEVCRSGVLDFTGTVDNLQEAKEISDHLPVFIIFRPRSDKKL